MSEDYRNKIVIKPWGYEYLVYENENVAIWYLHIDKGESTSMHCHPKKSTGLILLRGEAEVSFLADKRIIRNFDKVMIRRGLFHQTKALSDDGIDLLEVETPNDKHDLVRLQDEYGREDKPYETTWEPKDDKCLWFDDNEFDMTKFKGCQIGIERIDENYDILPGKDYFNGYLDGVIIAFLKGGMKRDMKKGNPLLAVVPGDVGFAGIMKKVNNQLDGFMEDTWVMTITKDIDDESISSKLG